MANKQKIFRQQQYVTVEGLQMLRQQLTDLKNTRSALAVELRNLTAQNDVNSAMYDQAQTISYGRASELDRQIGALERTIATAKIITKPDSGDGAELGSSVVIIIEGKQKNYTIVGSIEADPLNGKISDESPLGKSLLGKKAGDKITINTVSRRIQTTVVDIR